MRTVAGLNALKNTGVQSWNEQVYSSESYTGSAYAHAKAQTGYAMFGLNTDPLFDASYVSIDYAFYTEAATLYIYENGLQVANLGAWVAGERLEIVYANTTLTYYRNGVSVRSVSLAAGLTFFFDSSFYQNGQLNDLRFGPNQTTPPATFNASAGITLSGTQQRATASASRIAAHTIVEITDPDGNWRDLSQAIQGTDWVNGGSIEETADGNSQRFNLTLQRDVQGFQILSNPEFAGGSLNSFIIYDNAGTGLVSLTAEADAAAPSGWRMKVTSAAGAQPAPGIGGFGRNILPDNGIPAVNQYHIGSRIIWKILAFIPVGGSLNWASNGFGNEGSQRWLTSQAGFGDWYEYQMEQIIGRTGTFAGTGFFYITPSGIARPFTWWVRSIRAIDMTISLMTSLAPLRTDTAANRKMDGTYAPILDLNRRWRVRTAILPSGQIPVAADYEEIGNGFYDRLSVKDSPAVIQISGKDAGSVLLRGYIRVKRSYGTVGGSSLESVLQQIINDNAADNSYLPSTSGGITLVVFGGATGMVMNVWEQQPGNLMQALNAAAGKFGYIVRYRYDASDNLVLGLWKPNRTQTLEDFVLGPTEYLNIPVNDLGPLDQVKNLVEIRFWDAASGTIHTVQSPTLANQPSPSMSKYGTLYMGIDVSSSGPVNSDAKGQVYADAVRLDLETPALEQQIESYGLWWVQLGDYVRTLPNGTHYDTDQYGGVMAFTHTFGAGTWRTVINLKGKPAGRYATWLAQGTTDVGGTGGGGATPDIIQPPNISISRSATTPPTVSTETVTFSGGLGTGGSVFQWRYRLLTGTSAPPAWGAFATTPALPYDLAVTRGLKWTTVVEAQATDASGVIITTRYPVSSKIDALNDSGVVDDTVNMSGGARPFKRGIDTAVDVIELSSRSFIDQAGLDLSRRPISVYRGSAYEAVTNLFKRGVDVASDVIEQTGRWWTNDSMLDASRRIINVFRSSVSESVGNLFKRGVDTAADVIETTARVFINNDQIDGTIDRRISFIKRSGVNAEPTSNVFKRGVNTLTDVVDDGTYRKTGATYVDASNRPHTLYRATAGDNIPGETLASNLGADVENMVLNGGGQEGALGSQATSWNYIQGTNLVPSTSGMRIGDRSLYINGGGGSNSISYQDFNVVDQGVYELSGWVSVLSPAGSGQGAILAISIQSGATGFLIIEKVGYDPAPTYPDVGLGIALGTQDWTFVRSVFKMIGSGVIRLFIYYGYNGTLSGQSWFDGVKLRRVHRATNEGGFRGFNALTSKNRLVDQRNSIAVNTSNRNSVQQSDPLTAADVGTSATISIASHFLQFGFGTVSYNSGSIAGLAFNTTYYVYADDPDYLGGAVTYVATQDMWTAIANTGRYLVGKITTPQDGQAGTGGTGGGGCVDVDSWLTPKLKALDAQPGDAIDLYCGGDLSLRHLIDRVAETRRRQCVEIESAYGARLIVSADTPVTLRSGKEIKAAQLMARDELPILLPNGRIVWELVSSRPVGCRLVKPIYAGGGTFAASDRRTGARIFTHNMSKAL